ncbi:MAG TPA: GNAT family N-acetyltransferase [Bellilinea sp.]|nr:GNAT family N-acetyltransferase [Bellilinea sp.]
MKPTNACELETERLRLCALTLDEMRFAAENGIVEKVVNRDTFYLCVRQRGMTRAAYDRMKDQPAEVHPWYTVWVMVLKDGNEPVGVVGFDGLRGDGSTGIDYILSASHVGEGITSEAVPELVRWAFAREDCVRITGDAGRYNIGSQKVLEKSGFTLLREEEGRLYYELKCDK